MHLAFHEIVHLRDIVINLNNSKNLEENARKFWPHCDGLQTNQHLSCLEAHKSFIMDKRCRSIDAFSLLCLPKKVSTLLNWKELFTFLSRERKTKANKRKL